MEEELSSPFAAKTYESASPISPQKRSSKKFLWIVLTLIILGAGFFGIKKFIGSTTTARPTPTPTPTQEIFPTDTPTQAPSATSSPSTTPSPTTRPTTNPLDKATGLNRSDLSVDVQNGSGVVGAASKMADTLKSFGYKIASTGNADNFNYDGVTIQVKSDKSSFAALLKKDLSSSYTVNNTSTTLSASASADALVIVGK